MKIFYKPFFIFMLFLTAKSFAQDNNSPTDIQLSSTSLNENTGVNATVGMLTIEDLDLSDTHSYSFVSGFGDNDNAFF